MWLERDRDHPLARFGCLVDPNDPEYQAALAKMHAERVAQHIAEDAARRERRHTEEETPLQLLVDD